MGQDGVEMVFGLAGDRQVAAGWRGRACLKIAELPLGSRPLVRRLFIHLGPPALPGEGETELPVTVGVPVACLPLAPLGSGFFAETRLAIRATDEAGCRAELAAAHLTLVLRMAPGAGVYARFRTVVRVRDVRQTLRFSILHPVDGSTTWGEAAYAPPPPATGGVSARRFTRRMERRSMAVS